MVKTEGWELRLNELIESRLNTPFEWGQFDCCIFGLECIDAQCETDVTSPIKGSYSNKEEADVVLDALGGYEEAVKNLGLEEKDTSFASRGDICFIGDHAAMGVVVGSNILATGKRGLVSLPLSKIKKLWGIKCHR